LIGIIHDGAQALDTGIQAQYRPFVPARRTMRQSPYFVFSAGNPKGR
jgi:hypothetical protein